MREGPSFPSPTDQTGGTVTITREFKWTCPECGFVNIDWAKGEIPAEAVCMECGVKSALPEDDADPWALKAEARWDHADQMCAELQNR